MTEKEIIESICEQLWTIIKLHEIPHVMTAMSTVMACYVEQAYEDDAKEMIVDRLAEHIKNTMPHVQAALKLDS